MLGRGSALHGDKTPEWDGAALGSQKGLGFKRIRFIVFSCSRRPRWALRRPLPSPQLLVRVGLMLRQKDEVGRHGSQQHLTVERAQGGVRPAAQGPLGLPQPGASLSRHLIRIQSAAFWLAMSVSR